MIEITPYQSHWPEEFRQIGSVLRGALGSLALRIDHIGSTSVPGLAAKDRIDIQVTVTDLSEAVWAGFTSAGYERAEKLVADHIPAGGPQNPDQWRKWFFRPSAGQRATNVHVRLEGLANQRYPLLFRDFLRASPAASGAYSQVKMALARLHPEDIDAYYEVKDPACDLIMAGAECWAASSLWKPGPSDL